MVEGGGVKQALRMMVNKTVHPAWRALRSRGDPSVLAEAVRGLMGLSHAVGSNHEHLRAAMSWLCAAQDASPDDGVSAFYDLVAGAWAPSYPETTGYIIPTFFDYARSSGDDAYRQRAARMADWLLTLQLESGAFPMGPLWPDLEQKPIVFDTGQIIHGLVRTYEETGDRRYLEAARRAGNWLVEVQDADGAWRRFDFLDQVHTYNTRVAWALLRIDQISRNDRLRDAAVHHLRWAMSQQTPDGWFRHAGFTPDQEPLTHTLAYTVRGLLESGLLLSDETLVTSGQRAADALCEQQYHDGYLRGAYGPAWTSHVKWTCLTGNAQLAGIWLRLFQATGDRRYTQAAAEANRCVKRTQRRSSRLRGVGGGVAGAFPIYGDYHPYLYVNWAAKFLVDSLLLEEQLHTHSGRDRDGQGEHRLADV